MKKKTRKTNRELRKIENIGDKNLDMDDLRDPYDKL